MAGTSSQSPGLVVSDAHNTTDKRNTMARGDKDKKTKVKASKTEKEAKTKKKTVKEEKPARKTKKDKEEKAKKARSKRAERDEKPSKRKKDKAEKEDKKSKRASAKDKETKKSKRRKDDDENTEDVSTKKHKRSKLAVAVANGFNPYAELDDTLDNIDKDLGLGGSSLNLEDDRVHTGSLVLDMVVGKGVTAGWYTVFGPEQSCKSTGAMTMMIASMMSSVPILSYWDFEGSGQVDYIGHMLKTYGVPLKADEVFGVKDPKTSEWLVKPRVRYHRPQVAERFFDYLYKLMRRLPDKVSIGGTWYYVYEDTKDNRKIVGDRFDKNYWRKTKMLRVEAPDGSLQAMAIVDSYPAMLGEKLDDEDKNAGMAAQARMFSEQLRRVKGRMAAKRIAVVGVNQLRQRPGVMYGSPEYEPCGDALKYFCMTGDTLLFSEAGMLTADEMDYSYRTGKKFNIVGVEGKEECRFFDYKGHSQILELSTKFGYTIKGKPGHAVLSIQSGSPVRSFKKLEQLRSKGGTHTHYVAIKSGADVWAKNDADLSGYKPWKGDDKTSDTRHITKWVLPKKMTPELASVMGYLVGDGCIREGAVLFASREIEQTNNFVSNFAAAFSIPVKEITPLVHKNGVTITCRDIVEFLSFAGCGPKSSYQKTIPWAVRVSKKDSVSAFIRALFDSDASSGTKEITYASSSTVLIKQVHAALLNFGVVSNLHIHERRHSHGYDKGEVHHAKGNSIRIDGHCFERFHESVGFGLTRKAEKRNITNRGQNTTADILPKIWGWRTPISDQAIALITECSGKTKRCLRYRDFEDGAWYQAALSKVKEKRTQQQRDKLTREIDAFKDFIEFSIKNSIYWMEVKSVRGYQEHVATFDGNMPKTSTIITNGIVSHNSDVRLRFNARALSAVPYVKGKGMMYEEQSVMGKKFKDEYRHIHVRGIKNKLGMPYMEGWLRLWIKDGNEEPRGFDPVWDTFMYLENTGQISHRSRSKIVLKIKKHENTKPMDWIDFKMLILGTKKQQKEICEKFGLKWFDLREFCVNQMQGGKGMELFIECRKSSGEREEGDEDSDASSDEDDAD